MHIARRMPAPVDAGDVENILQDLANLQLENRQILGDRKNVAKAVQNAKKDDSFEKPTPVNEVIEISSTSESSIPPRFLAPKAHKLVKLTKSIAAATDNTALAAAVTEFVAVLQSNSSRNMTKEGFMFLDALYKQLADPSVFIVPMRTSRKRNVDKEQLQELEPRHIKLGVVARLKREVVAGSGNKELGEMVADFGAVTNKSSGRTITKDGFAFLEGLALRLRQLDTSR